MNFQPLKDFLDYYLPILGVPGSDTVIYKNHEEIFRYQSGFDSLRFRTPVKSDALYNIYSCSKVALGVAAAQLVERGDLVVTDPLYAYFPEYRDVRIKVKDESGNVIDTKKAEEPILIRHLLSMTSGMSYNIRSPYIREVVEKTDGRAPTLDVVRAFAKEPLDFEPGVEYQYSFSLDVMGGVIELITGKRFSDYMDENIFAPLGMKDTSYHYNKDKMFRLAVQYQYNEESHLPVEIPSDRCDYRFGTEFDGAGAGVISTVEDYILLADALANMGVGKNGERILSSYAVNLMRTNLLTAEQLKKFSKRACTGYGYGYGVRVNLKPEIAGNIAPKGQFGWDGAKLCYTFADPETKLALFHAEHMGGVHSVLIPRMRNIIYSCLEG